LDSGKKLEEGGVILTMDGGGADLCKAIMQFCRMIVKAVKDTYKWHPRNSSRFHGTGTLDSLYIAHFAYRGEKASSMQCRIGIIQTRVLSLKLLNTPATSWAIGAS
jgi:hypothetical protein